MTIGILFSGQGSQEAKMGFDFLGDYLFSKIISNASSFSGLNMLKILENKNKELSNTYNLQPTLTALNYGIYKLLRRDLPDLEVSCMAGLSLGEYSALISANALSLKQGIKLLVDRGKYMQEASIRNKGKMIALINPNIDEVIKVCNICKVEIANHNSLKQIVLGGYAPEINCAEKMIFETKAASRIIELKVSGAFHTSLFEEVQKQMAKSLDNIIFQDPKIPVISNTIIKPFNKENLATILAKQVSNPTYFGKDIEFMKNKYGVTNLIQIGPGKALTSFARQMSLGIKTYNISNMNEYQHFLKNYRNNS